MNITTAEFDVLSIIFMGALIPSLIFGIGALIKLADRRDAKVTRRRQQER